MFLLIYLQRNNSLHTFVSYLRKSFNYPPKVINLNQLFIGTPPEKRFKISFYKPLKI